MSHTHTEAKTTIKGTTLCHLYSMRRTKSCLKDLKLITSLLLLISSQFYMIPIYSHSINVIHLRDIPECWSLSLCTTTTKTLIKSNT